MPCRTRAEQTVYNRKWVAERRRQYFEDKECVHCGTKTNLVNHHTDRSTKKSHNVWSWTEAKRNEELAKCVVLCAECHKKEHTNKDYHGTSNGYDYYGCRCEPCRKANTLRQRAKRSKTC